LKFSYNWIRELVPGLAEAPGPLERLITMKTAECEGVEPACELLARATLARVESPGRIWFSRRWMPARRAGAR
jgi:hypothetical protein